MIQKLFISDFTMRRQMLLDSKKAIMGQFRAGQLTQEQYDRRLIHVNKELYELKLSRETSTSPLNKLSDTVKTITNGLIP